MSVDSKLLCSDLPTAADRVKDYNVQVIHLDFCTMYLMCMSSPLYCVYSMQL